MHRAVSACLLVGLLAISASYAQGPSTPRYSAVEQSSQTQAALVAAYQELDKERFVSVDCTIVIRRIRKFIVVSFRPSSPNVRDGSSDVVYDPVKRRVVYTRSDG